MCIREEPKTQLASSQKDRTLSIQYQLGDQRGEIVRVCKPFFLTTLGFKPKNDKALLTLLRKTENNVITPEPEKRGHKSPKNKIDLEPVVAHIEKFHPTTSHYRREHAPNARYLPSDVNATIMHKDFCEKHPNLQVSLDFYRKQIKAMKIHFTKLGHEECEKCESMDLHDSLHSKEALDPDCEVCQSWNLHIQKASLSRKKYREYGDQQLPDGVLCFSVDLEKVIMLPRIDTFKSVLFSKRISLYNESFVPVGKMGNSKTFAVLWHEGISGRCKEDLVDAYHALFTQHRDAKKIILWLDNCTAQNKNWCFCTYLIHIVNSSQVSMDSIELL